MRGDLPTQYLVAFGAQPEKVSQPFCGSMQEPEERVALLAFSKELKEKSTEIPFLCVTQALILLVLLGLFSSTLHCHVSFTDWCAPAGM